MLGWWVMMHLHSQMHIDGAVKASGAAGTHSILLYGSDALFLQQHFTTSDTDDAGEEQLPQLSTPREKGHKLS